jgi:hypothetical protein
MKILGEPRAVYTRENLMALEKLNIDPPLQDALRQALNHISFSRPYVMEIAVRVWFLDYYYNRSRVYKAIDFVRKKYY